MRRVRLVLPHGESFLGRYLGLSLRQLVTLRLSHLSFKGWSPGLRLGLGLWLGLGLGSELGT